MSEEVTIGDGFPDQVIPESDVPDHVGELEDLVNAWIDTNIQYYKPFHWRGSNERYWRKKTFTEAGMYLLDARGFGRNDLLPELQDRIIDQVNDRRYSHLMLRNPRELHHYIYPAIYARETDRLEPETTDAVVRAAERGGLWNGEHLPFRQLEFWYISTILSDMFDYTPKEHDVERILNASILHRRPTSIRCTYREAYYLTHDVMFYNNFLQVSNKVFPDQPAPYDISVLLRGLILRYMAEDNCDIVLELLASGVHQRQLSRQMVRFVLSWVLEKAEPLGYVPGPDPDGAIIDSLESPDKNSGGNGPRWNWDHDSQDETIWARNVHTNIVAGLAARLVERDWEKLDVRSTDHGIDERSFRRDLARLGQMLRSLAEYDLKKGAIYAKKLAESPVRAQYEDVFHQGVEFLRGEQASDSEVGYWPKEEILFTNAGSTREAFKTEMVHPISNACSEALDAIDATR